MQRNDCSTSSITSLTQPFSQIGQVLSRHVCYVFTLVSLLFFTSLMQPFLLSERFSLRRSFREYQCLQEA